MDLVVDGLPAEAVLQLALEEALTRCPPAEPTLRLWQTDSAVVVGRFQEVAREVALAACAQDGVMVARRISGGGTVVHDLGSISVSLTVPGRVLGADGWLAAVLIAALSRLGVVAERRTRGLFVRDRKISGSAVLQSHAATLAHATLLVATSAATIERYLATPPEVPDRRDSHRCPVTSLQQQGVDVDVPTASAVVLAAAGEQLRARPLTDRERVVHQRLLQERYRDPAWHMTGRTREGAWTTPLVSSSTE